VRGKRYVVKICVVVGGKMNKQNDKDGWFHTKRYNALQKTLHVRQRKGDNGIKTLYFLREVMKMKQTVLIRALFTTMHVMHYSI
jgi:hypothetical protein